MIPVKGIYLIIFAAFISTCKTKKNEVRQMPSFNFFLADGFTYYNTNSISKGKTTIFIYFSPDCDHCQDETEILLKNINLFKQVQFYFITNDPMERLNIFYYYYKIDKYPNITLGQDYSFYFLTHFNPNGPPYILIYDKNKQQRAICAGEAPINLLTKIINSL